MRSKEEEEYAFKVSKILYFRIVRW